MVLPKGNPFNWYMGRCGGMHENVTAMRAGMKQWFYRVGKSLHPLEQLLVSKVTDGP